MILVSNQNNATFRKATSAMNDPMLPLAGLSPVAGKNVVVKFDGGRLSSDGGILTLREIEGRVSRVDVVCLDARRSNQLIAGFLDVAQGLLQQMGRPRSA